MAEQEYYLKWNDHHSTLAETFRALLLASRYTDCTISAEGQNVDAHKVLLTACSPYFDSVFQSIKEGRHAVIVLSNVTFAELQALVDYMYCGEVNVPQDRIPSLLKAAKLLQIRGLYDLEEEQVLLPPHPAPDPPHVAPSDLPTGLGIERPRQTTPDAASDFAREASDADAVCSPEPKRRKRVSYVDGNDLLPDGVPLLPEPPRREEDHASEAVGPKQELLDDKKSILEENNNEDDDDDDRTEQPETYVGEGSSQGTPPPWNDRSNDVVSVASQGNDPGNAITLSTKMIKLCNRRFQ